MTLKGFASVMVPWTLSVIGHLVVEESSNRAVEQASCSVMIVRRCAADRDRLSRPFLEKLGCLNNTERAVFSEVVFLLKTFLFVYIGVSLRWSGLGPLLIGLLLTGSLFAVRILVVNLALTPRLTSRSAAAISGAMDPNGLAAAVVATLPIQMNLAGGEQIQDVTYNVILLSILGTSICVFLLERGWLEGLTQRIYRRFPKNLP